MHTILCMLCHMHVWVHKGYLLRDLNCILKVWLQLCSSSPSMLCLYGVLVEEVFVFEGNLALQIFRKLFSRHEHGSGVMGHLSSTYPA